MWLYWGTPEDGMNRLEIALFTVSNCLLDVRTNISHNNRGLPKSIESIVDQETLVSVSKVFLKFVNIVLAWSLASKVFFILMYFIKFLELLGRYSWLF